MDQLTHTLPIGDQESILLVANSPSIGGGNRSLLLLATNLRNMKYPVHIAIPNDGEMSDECAKQGFHAVCHHPPPPSISPVQLIRNIAGWRGILKSTRPTLVHTNDVSTARSIGIAAYTTRTPVVCHIRFPPDAGTIDWAFRRVPAPAAFILNSRATLRECEREIRHSCPKSRISVVHNAVDTTVFAPGELPPHQLPRIGILANLIPLKGHLDFIEMASILTKGGTNAEFWIIGEDIHEQGTKPSLQKRVSDLGLEGIVRFLGHQRDVPSILNQLSVLVCASHEEPFGRCIIEGMACGVPVVATKVGGIPEIVDHNKTGLLVPPRSPKKLASAVNELLTTPRLCQQFKKAGRDLVVDRFTPYRITMDILSTYANVLAEPSNR